MFNKSEEEIISQWISRDEKPLVTIACLTYNHEQYIKDALDSFLMQETDFAFEIVIHDDASSDRTQHIIKEYMAKYPSLIKAVFQQTNQYEIHRRINIDFIFDIDIGKYIAFCEGDDYWNDPKKLQKQFNVLEKNSNINMCLHYAELWDEQTQKVTGTIGQYKVKDDNSIIPFEDIIVKKYGQIPTASTFIRATTVSDLKSFFWVSQASIFDVFLHMLSAKENGAYLIKETMSTYRVNVPGSWNDKGWSGEFDSHAFKRAEAFKAMEDYVDERFIPYLRESTFEFFLFSLRMSSVSKVTKRKILEVIRNDLTLTQNIYYTFLTEFSFFHWYFGTIKRRTKKWLYV